MELKLQNVRIVGSHHHAVIRLGRATWRWSCCPVQRLSLWLSEWASPVEERSSTPTFHCERARTHSCTSKSEFDTQWQRASHLWDHVIYETRLFGQVCFLMGWAAINLPDETDHHRPTWPSWNEERVVFLIVCSVTAGNHFLFNCFI